MNKRQVKFLAALSLLACLVFSIKFSLATDFRTPTASFTIHKYPIPPEKVKKVAGNSDDPYIRIQALNAVIFKMEGFHYDFAPNSRTKEVNYFLNRTLD